MTTTEKEFENWAYDQWEEECEDHWIFGEKVPSFSEYLKQNYKQLRKQYDNAILRI